MEKLIISDEDFVEDDEAVVAAKNAFGVNYLFPWQRLVISNILDSFKSGGVVDEEGDVFCRGRQIVLLPTGAGKSMCFLVPSILFPGPTLVLYPLLALMSDQQRRMESGAIKCVVFKGGQSEEEREENFKWLEKTPDDPDYENRAKVILANPEVLQNEALVERLSKVGISHIAIDEAHCVSEWGDSFRPAYLTLGKIIKDLGVKVVTAFTATASPVVLNRVAEVLFDGDVHIVRSAGDRANIHYEVRYAYAKKMAVLKAAATEERPLIVFCGTRRRTEGMAELLASYFGLEKVRFYHAGLEKEEKKQVEKWFMDSTDGILACTCAFGMGVDKADVRTVVHLDLPEHLENFVQEAGRAGRDGSNVKSILIFDHNDALKNRLAEAGSREKVSGDYALHRGCRRQFILDYLAAEKTSCSGCDFCDAEREGRTLSYKSEDAQMVLHFLRWHRRLFSREELLSELLDLLNDSDTVGCGKNGVLEVRCWTTRDISEILSQLTSENKIMECGGLWKGKMDIVHRSLVLKLLPSATRHNLHRLRFHHRHFLQRLEQMNARLGEFLEPSVFFHNLQRKLRNSKKEQRQ